MSVADLKYSANLLRAAVVLRFMASQRNAAVMIIWSRGASSGRAVGWNPTIRKLTNVAKKKSFLEGKTFDAAVRKFSI